MTIGYARFRVCLGVGLLCACMLGLGSGCVATAVGASDGVTPLREFLARTRAAKERDPEYRLVPGDQITVRFFFNPQLESNLWVRPDGLVQMTLIGELQAAGKTPTELSQAITRAYAQYFVKPQGVVIVRTFSNNRVFADGLVRDPGQFDLMTGAHTVLEGLSIAGGVLDAGSLTHVFVVRKLPAERVPLVAELDLTAYLSGEDPSQDVELMPEDYIFVPRSGAANVNLALQQYLFNNGLRWGARGSIGTGFYKYLRGAPSSARGTSGGNTGGGSNNAAGANTAGSTNVGASNPGAANAGSAFPP